MRAPGRVGLQKAGGRVAVLIPCYNEELTIDKVINDFRTVFPSADIYVFDNDSSDRTAEIAREHGAEVIREKRRGKGYVVRSMFQKVSADVYIMVDGDDTYPAEQASIMLEMIEHDEADMVVGSRLQTYADQAFRPLHVLGNNLVRRLVNRIFATNLTDIMSGLRVMNRDLVHGIVIQSTGFEVETEMTIQSLNRGFVIKEHSVPYRERPAGSFSKLNTFQDGLRVLKTILVISRDYRPLAFFSLISLLFLLAGLASGSVVVHEFVTTRFITHVPLAILSVGLTISSLVMFAIGLILDSIKNRFAEIQSFIRTRMS
jgi:glycosyltransferase involved in cell wall biosynthesis